MGVEALLNAASKFESRGELQLAELTRQALAVAKLPMFMRSEEDIRDDKNLIYCKCSMQD